MTLFITHVAHFPLQVLPVFPKNVTATEAFPPCVKFQRIQFNGGGRDFCCCTEGSDQARMPLLLLTLRANPVSSSKQQCMGALRLAYPISEDFPLPFTWLFLLPFLSFPSHCPSIFYSRKTRHSSHKHPSINCLSYKPLIS